MAATSALRAASARAATSLGEMRRAAEHMPPARPLKVGAEFALIAEIKRAAPSAGDLRADVQVGARAAQYEAGGAAAISVLTEPKEFRGSLNDLRECRESSNIPAMRKDFLVDNYQLYEARANGADGVLLIAPLFANGTLKEAVELADYLGMFALVEAFDALDIERAQEAGARFVGVNCRNLRDLRVDFARFARLRPLIDDSRVSVAESGITSGAELQQVRALGYRAALVGSALMREDDPVVAMARLRGES
jgi:indole-3-glycerol phosphate synthase